MLPLVVAKLQKLIEQDLLEHDFSGGSKWTSPIVVLRKSDGDIRICGDYKIGVNPKVCSDSYPLPNVEVAFHALTFHALRFYKNRFENGIPPNTNKQ